MRAVPLPRSEVELTLERDVAPAGGAPRRVRLSHRFAIGPDGSGPSPEELRAALTELERQFETLVGSATGTTESVVRPDRELPELIDTYRPRQSELLELLRADGELTEREFSLLTEYLAGHPPSAKPVPVAAAVDPIPETDRPIAAAPLANDRTPAHPRPVPELLSQYRIESLKQAGAVRARRQISYEEYMSLKRHFNELERRAAEPAAG